MLHYETSEPGPGRMAAKGRAGANIDNFDVQAAQIKNNLTTKNMRKNNNLNRTTESGYNEFQNRGGEAYDSFND